MNQQERQIISDIFRRLEEAANQPRDPEAERFIAEKLRAQPYAPYAMAQAIYVQEQALASLNGQMQELQAEVEQLRNRPQGGGGLLSSIFGGGSRPEPRRGASFGDARGGMGGPQTGPWGSASSQGYGGPQGGYGQPGPGYGQPGMMGGQPGMMGGFGQQRQGSGFLGSALTTAAGVAGGMVVGSALMNAFKGGHETLGGGASALAGGADAAGATGSDAASLSPFGDTGNAGAFGGGENPLGAQDASFGGGNDGFDGDFSDDGGGGGDEWV